MHVRLLPAALEDLQEIGLYIARDNLTRAYSFIDELYERCQSLSEYAHRGARRDHILPELRLLTHKGYNIYYRVNDADVLILRILHGARDISGDDLS